LGKPISGTIQGRTKVWPSIEESTRVGPSQVGTRGWPHTVKQFVIYQCGFKDGYAILRRLEVAATKKASRVTGLDGGRGVRVKEGEEHITENV